MRRDRDAFLRLIESILAQTSDPWVLENLGAGPLEDLLTTGDPTVIDFIEKKYRTYPNLVEAMRYMWMDDFPAHSRQFAEKILTES